MAKPQSDEAGLRHTQQAAASLKRALENFYEGDPVHDDISGALRDTQRVVSYLESIRGNK